MLGDIDYVIIQDFFTLTQRRDVVPAHISIIDDSILEGNEMFEVKLKVKDERITVNPYRIAVTIVDDDGNFIW